MHSRSFAVHPFWNTPPLTVSHKDNRGNLTGHNEWSYSYDADNRLVSATKSGYGVYFYYDAEGRLSKVNRNGAWEYRYYDGAQCFFRSTANGTWIDLIIWGLMPDELNARYAPASGWSFFHREPINSVDVATDIGGNVVERYLYNPFGKPDIRDGSWNVRSSSAIANPYLFTGQNGWPISASLITRTASTARRWGASCKTIRSASMAGI